MNIPKVKLRLPATLRCALLWWAVLLGATAGVTSAANLTFVVGPTNGVTNSFVTVPIRARQFTNISAFQFSFHWNTNVASFAGIDLVGFPSLTTNEFGVFASTGTLTVVWFDLDGTSKSFPDDTTVFGVRLRLIGPAAATSTAFIDGSPTRILAGDENLSPVPVSIIDGALNIDRTLIVTCSNNKTVECGSVWNFDPPIATDSCGGLPVTTNILSTLTNFGLCGFTATRTWEIIDRCTNRTTCVQTVTAVDTTPPVPNCAPNKTVECGSAWIFDQPTAFDNCSATLTINAVSTLTNATAQCGATATRVWEILDTCGNRSTCTQVVSVVDTTAPVLTCAAPKTVECGSIWNFDPPTAIDACRGILVPQIFSTVSNATGVCGYTMTRTWEVSDLCSNRSTCSQTVTVVDTTKPLVTCSVNKTVECGSVWTFDTPTAIDNCAGVLPAHVFTIVTNLTGTCGYTATCTWEFIDPCNNRATCEQTVTVIDTTPPVIVCAPNKTVECGSAWSFGQPITTDACTASSNLLTRVFSTLTNAPGTCGYTVTRTWEAFDSCSNRSTCSQTVTVVDTTPPVPACTQPTKTVEFGTPWTFDAPTGIDNCSTTVRIQIVSTSTNFGCGPSFIATRTWELLDDCTNRSTCTQIVTVRDTTAPVITCPVLTKNVNCLGAWTFDAPTAVDVATGLSITPTVGVTTTNGSCGSGFTAVRTWTATDSCGNSASCSQTVFGRAIVTVGGTVYAATNYPPTISDKRVAGATVLAPTNVIGTSLTDGSYSCVFDAANNVVITPHAPTTGRADDGVDAIDILVVRKHILSAASIVSPYKLLAADVDGDGTISALDLLSMRRVVLGTTNRFPTGLWRFVPASYSFANPLNPWGAPTNRTYASVGADLAGEDFVAIKLGDVNSTWIQPPGFAGATPVEKHPLGEDAVKQANAGETPVTFLVGSTNGFQGTNVSVPIRVTSFTNVAAFQFSFHWDPTNLTLIGVEQFNLSDLAGSSFNLASSNSGTFTVLWYDPNVNGVSVADGTSLFSVRFKCVGAASGLSSLTIDGNPTRFLVTDPSPAAVPSAAVPGQITIDQTNRTPVLGGITDQTVNEGALFTFTATVSDPDGVAQTETFSLDPGSPAGASINSSSGAFTWTPTEAQGPGIYPVTIRVTDNGVPPLSAVQSFNITVNEVNSSPVLTAIGNKSVSEGSLLTFTAFASDPDVPAQILAFSLVGAPAGASIDSASGVFTWTPTEAQGPNNYQVTVRVTDNGSPVLSASEIITITVNEVNSAPVLTPIGNKSVNEGNLLTFTANATDSDTPAQTLSFTLDAGAPAGANINPSSGVFTWTPTEAQGPSNYLVTVRVADNNLPSASASETISIAVNEVNVAPSLATIGNKVVDEGSLLTFTATGTDLDLPAQTLTYSLSNAPAGASINASNGVFTWTPTEAQGPGSYAVTVRVTDNGSPTLSASETITITVNDVPAAPVLATIGNKSVNEGSLLTFTASATDADLPAQTLTYSLSNAPAGASINSANGVFTWTPTEVQGPGTYVVTVRVIDNDSPPLSASETITITVNEVNIAPVLTTIGNKSVNEGSLLAFTAAATDADVPAQILTYSLSNAPAGASINSASGAFAWTPTEAQGPGSYIVTVLVTDNGSPVLSASETITITVNELTTAPVLAAIGNKVVDEGVLLTFTASATDADLPAQTLTYSLSNAPAGASINSANGVFTWTPTEAQGPGSYVVTVRVTDNGSPALSASETITITVNDVNASPVLASIGNKSVTEGTLLTFTASATDTDLPAQTLSYSISNAPAGASINSASGVFTWTPTEAQGPGSYLVTVRVTDNGSPILSASEAITITVNEGNSAPVLNPIGNKTVNEGVSLTFTASAADSDVPAQTLTYSLDAGAPTGASVNSSSGLFTWTPTEAQGSNSYVVTVRVADNGLPALSASETITITVNEVNTTPVLTTIGNKSVNEGSLLTFTASATDADLPAQALTYSLSNAPAGASINSANGVFAWTPTEAQGPGSYVVTVIVTDNGSPALNASETITITVNEVNIAPVLATIGNKSVNEGSLLTFIASATDADLPAQILTYSLSNAPAGASINSASGAFAWTPTEAQGPGSYVVTVIVTDNGSPALNASETITITVNEVNISPVLTTIGNKSVNEGVLLTFTAVATDADLPAQTLTYSVSNAPAGASINSANGVFTWTPTEAQGPGSYLVTVLVTDNGFPAMTAAETITITVNEVNVAPVLAVIGNKAASEGNQLSFTASATDADLPAQTLTFSLIGQPAGASIGSASGVFTWTPSQAQARSTNVLTVRVTDNGSPALNASETITIVVGGANAAPVLAAIGNKAVDEGTLLTFTASATDIDGSAQTLTFSLDPGALAGASINSSNGVFTWTPTEAQGPGSYPVTVRVTDNGVPSLSGSETITIVVNEVNIAPNLASIGSKSVSEGSLLTFTASATDADLPAQILTYSLSNAPTGANINSASGVFTWTPTEAQGPGTYFVTVRVTDNGSPALAASETITITVNEVNASPVLATIGNKTVNEGSVLTFTASATDADFPAQTLTFSLDPGVPAGANINSASGLFTWTPSEAQGPSNYLVTVRVTDNGSPVLSASETISIAVNEVNAAPVLASIGNKGINEGNLLTFTATATDADLPAQTLSYSLSNAPAGASINSSNGVFTWTPSAAQGPSNYVVTVRVTDNGSPALSASETISIAVGEVNTAPVLSAIGNKTVIKGTLLAFVAIASDTDQPMQTLTFTLGAGAPVGASIDSSTGLFTWTPTDQQSPSTNIVTVIVTDSGSPALSDSKTFTILVNNQNSPPTLAAIGDKAATAGAALTFTASASDVDLPTQTLTWSLDSGLPLGASINSASGAFTWTPTDGQAPGTYPMTIRVTDSGTPNLSASETITIVVTEFVPPTISISDVTIPGGTDGLLEGEFEVSLSAPAGRTVSVDFATADGNALAGTDYAPTNGTLIFPPGTTNLIIGVTVAGNSTIYTNRTFFVNLSNPTNGIIDDGSALATITSEFAPGLYIDDVVVTEGNRGEKVNAVFTVSLNGPNDRLVTVSYAAVKGTALSRKDFKPKKGKLKFPPGTTTQTITVPITGDALDEDDETFFVNLSKSVNSVIVDGQGVGTILDNDPLPGIAVSDVTTIEANTGARAVSFVVRLSAKSGRTVSVDFNTIDGTAIAGSDYVATNGSLVFPAGVLTRKLVVPVLGNTMSESNETFFVNLANAVNATVVDGLAIGNIRDNDRAPSVSVSDGSVAIGDLGAASALFTVQLSAPSEKLITVNFATAHGTAIAGTDYVVLGNAISFEPGATSVTISIDLLNNPAATDSRTFFLDLISAENAKLGNKVGTCVIPGP